MVIAMDTGMDSVDNGATVPWRGMHAPGRGLRLLLRPMPGIIPEEIVRRVLQAIPPEDLSGIGFAENGFALGTGQLER